jgi:hypothetical protein
MAEFARQLAERNSNIGQAVQVRRHGEGCITRVLRALTCSSNHDHNKLGVEHNFGVLTVLVCRPRVLSCTVQTNQTMPKPGQQPWPCVRRMD